MKTAPRYSSTNNAFSLVELLAVILIISIILAFAVPGFVSRGPSRKGNIAEISAFLEKARALAIASKRDVYVCFADNRFPSTEESFRAMTVFMASSLNEENNPVDTRLIQQIENIFLLPDDLVFADQSDLVSQGADGNALTILDSEIVRDFPFLIQGQTVNATLPYLLFNKSGRLEVPFFSDSQVFVAIAEGYVENGGKVLIGNEDRDRSELIRINYRTGAITTLVQ